VLRNSGPADWKVPRQFAHGHGPGHEPG
jgi:hypothetical protein